MKKFLANIITGVESDKPEMLGDVVSFLNLGSNRELREKGVRIVNTLEDILADNQDKASACLLLSEWFATNRKTIPLVKDPKFLLQHSNVVFQPNGSTAFVFRIVTPCQTDSAT